MMISSWKQRARRLFQKFIRCKTKSGFILKSFINFVTVLTFVIFTLITIINLSITDDLNSAQQSLQTYQDQIMSDYFRYRENKINNEENKIKKTKLKLFVVVSNGIFDPYDKPQLSGMLDTLNCLAPYVQCDIETKYLEISTLDIQKKESKSRETIEEIKKVKPDIVVTIGNDSFEMIGERIAFEKIPVLYSGVIFDEINDIAHDSDFSDIRQYIGGINGSIDVSSFFKIMKQKRLFSLFNGAYILTSKDLNSFDLKVIGAYTDCLQKYFQDITVKQFITTEELRNFLIEMNESRKKYIYLLCFDNIYDTYSKKIINKIDTYRLVSLYNHTQLEISNNPIFSKYSNIMVGIGPNYYRMGQILGFMILKYSYTKQPITDIKDPNIEIAINYDRLIRSGYKMIYDAGFYYFDTIW